MDRLFEKLRSLIIRAGEQVLVVGVKTLHLITFAILTMREPMSAASLGDLIWDQFSTPSPPAPAGNLTFWLLKVWTDYIIEVELLRFRNLFRGLLVRTLFLAPRKPPIETLDKLLRSIGLHPPFSQP